MKIKKEYEIYTEWFKRRKQWGFFIRYLWQDNKADQISNHIVREISFQLFWWYSEIMIYQNL